MCKMNTLGTYWTAIHALPATPQSEPSDISSDDLVSFDRGRQEPTNLVAALLEHISEARAAETATDYSKAVQRAWDALSALCDNAVTCRCGGLLDRLTGICGECVERRTQLDADFARKIEAGDHAYAAALAIDTTCGF